MRPKRKADGSTVVADADGDGDANDGKEVKEQKQYSKRPAKRAKPTDTTDSIEEKAIELMMDVDNKELGYVMRSAARESRKLGLTQSVSVTHVSALSAAQITYINRNVSPALIHNVVAKAQFNHRFSVADLAMRLHGLHNRRKFSAPVCLGMKHPRVTALVFSTGTVVVVGAKSDDIARLAIYRLADYIARQTGIVVKPSGITINNIMATVYLGYRVDLKRVCTSLKQANGEYPKIVFGAAKIYVKGGVVMLFSSGKFVVCGPRHTDELIHIRDDLIPKLAQFHNGDVDLEKQRREQQEAKELERREAERRRQENDIRKIRKKIEGGKRRLRHKYPSSAVSRIVDLEEIKMDDCMHLVGARVALANAIKNGTTLPVPTVAAIHADKDVCRHRLRVRFKNAATKELHKIGWLGSMDILRLYRQNGLEVPAHFSVPPPPVQKRRGSTKNPNHDDGEFHQIEGEVLRFDFVGAETNNAASAGQKRRRVTKVTAPKTAK